MSLPTMPAPLQVTWFPNKTNHVLLHIQCGIGRWYFVPISPHEQHLSQGTTAVRPSPGLCLPCCHTRQYFGSLTPLSSCRFRGSNECRGNSWDCCLARWSTGEVGTKRWFLELLLIPALAVTVTIVPKFLIAHSACSVSCCLNIEAKCHHPYPKELRRK